MVGRNNNKRQNDITIGKRLRECRQNLGWSLRDAADIIHMHHTTLWKREHGRHARPEQLTVIARDYGVKVQDFSRPPGSPWSRRAKQQPAAAVQRPPQKRWRAMFSFPLSQAIAAPPDAFDIDIGVPIPIDAGRMALCKSSTHAPARSCAAC
jgi:transcriptional regulator with XRE-family HTH domain